MVCSICLVFDESIFIWKIFLIECHMPQNVQSSYGCHTSVPFVLIAIAQKYTSCRMKAQFMIVVGP